MKVQLKCLSSLSKSKACGYKSPTPVHVPENSTVASVISKSGVQNTDVKIIFVNGKLADTGKHLAENDSVTLVPAVGGM